MITGENTVLRGCGRRVLFAEEKECPPEERCLCLEQREGRFYLQVHDPCGEQSPTAEEICCAGKMIWDRGFRECPVTLESPAGRHLILCSLCGEKVTAVTAGVGKCSFDPKEIPLRFETPLINDPLTMEGTKPFRVTALRFGDPYVVVFLDTVGDCALLERGRELGKLHLFPYGAEVLFVYARGEKILYVRVYHRDGTENVRGNDVCAALGAAVATGRCLPDTAVTVPLPEGDVRAVCTKDWDLFFTCAVSEEKA